MTSGVMRIGCGAGFSGDRTDAGAPVAATLAQADGPGALFFETLGERTLALAHRRRRNGEPGYEPLLEAYLTPVLGSCIARGIPILGNFGAADPPAAGRLVADLAVAAGFPNARVAVVTGDDVTDLLQDQDVAWLDNRATPAVADVICANAYLGAAPLREALEQGADVVVAGRVADPALCIAPVLASFGSLDIDRLAAVAMAGHLLECGAQVTGGYFADPGYKDVPEPERIGFPISEITADGDVVITKPPGTGGLVTLASVTEQLLYEVHDPSSYITPDVVLDISNVSLEEDGPDRVRVTGARGRPAPAQLKATVSLDGGWLGEGEISYAGPNAEARGRLALEVLQARAPAGLRTRGDLIGVTSVLGEESGETLARSEGRHTDVRVRFAADGPDRTAVERAVAEVLALYTCGPAGGAGVRTSVRSRVATRSVLLPREKVEARVHVDIQSAQDLRRRNP